MDLLQGTTRKQDGKVDKGRRSFLLLWKKESYLPLVIARGSVLEGGRGEGGVADDDHRSSYSTIVDGSSIDGKGRTPGQSCHCVMLNANVKSDLILDKFNNSLPRSCTLPNSSCSNHVLKNARSCPLKGPLRDHLRRSEKPRIFE